MGRIYLNDGWLFEEEFTDRMLLPGYESARAASVRLPHTCRETPFHYFDERLYQMVCGYRRELFAPQEWEGRSVSLVIEAAGHSAWVYLNGELLAEHHCGYTAFCAELSRNLRYGESNVLVIKVDSREQQNIPPFGFVVDYMTYGGLYREVYLEVREKLHIADVFVRGVPNGTASTALLRSDVTLSCEAAHAKLRQYLLPLGCAGSGAEKDAKPQDEKGSLLCEQEISTRSLSLAREVPEAGLWSVERPYLYLLTTELSLDGALVDVHRVRFGFRRAEFRADGFYLNGEKLKLRGLNRHQSYPYVGYAMPASMQRQDADLLKRELGCNAVRTSHYPQSHHFIDRCDELGLLVFMEFPGWQHIGDAAWKEQALVNEREMIEQYRNHTSIILWGVRINESKDDEEFYTRTNALAHTLDDRPTGGVRAIKKSQFFEDVYTYNDFLHDGKAAGCEKKEKVTPDLSKPYLISEYNGHMFPTKSFDCEEHRAEHAIRHANVLDAAAAEDIAGSFGWCMFDYNTHKDFGSGDRICYHGVMDMFRNPKLAACVYACQQEETPVLELSSGMDIGEHPGCQRGSIYLFTNAESVRMYKNDVFIKEYRASDSPYRHLPHGPILLDDYVGDTLREEQGFSEHQAELVKYAFNYVALHGYGKLPPKLIRIALECVTVYHMKPDQIVDLYTKYVGDWGGTSTVYRFEAIRNKKVVKTITKEPMHTVRLSVTASHTRLREEHSYDVAELFIRAQDEHGNLLTFFEEPVTVTTEGPVSVIGPDTVPLRGGSTGVYIKTTGAKGAARVHIHCAQTGASAVEFSVE